MQRIYYSTQTLFKALTEHRPHEVISYFKQMVDENALQETNSRNLTLLQLAAREGYVDAVLMLNYAGADVNQTAEVKHEDPFSKNQAESSAFYLAMQRGHKQVAEILLVCGADKSKAIECAQRDRNPKLAELISHATVSDTTLRYMLFWTVKNYSQYDGDRLFEFLKPFCESNTRLDNDVSALIELAENEEKKEVVQALLILGKRRRASEEKHEFTGTELAQYQRMALGLELKDTIENDSVDSIADYASRNKQFVVLKGLLSSCNVPRLLARVLRDRNKDLASFILVHHHFDRHRVMSDLFRKKLFHYWLYYCDSPQGCLHEIMSRAVLKGAVISAEQHQNIEYLKKHQVDVTNALLYCIADRYTNPHFVSLMTSRDIAIADRIRLLMQANPEVQLNFHRKTTTFLHQFFAKFKMAFALPMPATPSRETDLSYRLPGEVWTHVNSFLDAQSRARMHCASSYFDTTFKKMKKRKETQTLLEFKNTLQEFISTQNEVIQNASSFLSYFCRNKLSFFASTALSLSLFSIAEVCLKTLDFIDKAKDDARILMQTLMLYNDDKYHCWDIVSKKPYFVAGYLGCDEGFENITKDAVAQCIGLCEQYNDSSISYSVFALSFVIFAMMFGLSIGHIYSYAGFCLRRGERSQLLEADPDFTIANKAERIQELAKEFKLGELDEMTTPAEFLTVAKSLLERINKRLAELTSDEPEEEKNPIVVVSIEDKQQAVEVDDAEEEEDRSAALQVPLLQNETKEEEGVEMTGMRRVFR